MNSALLNSEIQEFIDTNIGTEINTLALKKNPFPGANWTDIIHQIVSKSKSKTKLPFWYGTKNILYPSKVSIEQTSSEKTAYYKSTLVSGQSLIDLSGGFGVDDFFFSKKIEKVIHCEINAELSEIVTHNFQQLKVSNIECQAGDSTSILKQLNQKFDWIYVDPSRRNDTKGKVFLLKDCLPNVPELLDFYFEYSSNILIKTAPLLDISAGLSELQYVKAIHIIAIDNEVKELLWEIEKNYNKNPRIKTVHIRKEDLDKFEFEFLDSSLHATYSLPKTYLYEPNAAIMKSGGFEAVSALYSIDKLQLHSHLYTSDQLLSIPARVFKIQQCLSYTKPNMKQFIENQRANVTTRNFPETVALIRKKWKIKEGGNSYCFFTTDLNNNKIVLICTKI